MESSTLPRAVGVNATVVASENVGSSHYSGEAAERTSAEVARAEETATAKPVDMETTVGGATSSEPPARQIIPRGKDLVREWFRLRVSLRLRIQRRLCRWPELGGDRKSVV